MEIGPALPPHLSKILNPGGNKINEEDKSEEKPPPEDIEESDDCESYGPALPPGFQRKEESVSMKRVIGPMRPPQFEHPRADTSGGLYEKLLVEGIGSTLWKTI